MNRQDIENTDDPTINILPLDSYGATDEIKKQLLELQLKMTTCSINHEYARMEFEDVRDQERKAELLDFMNECHSKYFEARSELSAYDPYALLEFEADLMRQKQLTFGGPEVS